MVGLGLYFNCSSALKALALLLGVCSGLMLIWDEPCICANSTTDLVRGASFSRSSFMGLPLYFLPHWASSSWSWVLKDRVFLGGIAACTTVIAAHAEQGLLLGQSG